MVTLAHDNPYPSVLMVEGDPEALEANPAVGQRRLAVGTDHLLYLVDDAGAATLVGSTGSGDVATDTIWDAAGDLVQGTGADTAARLALGAAGYLVGSTGSTNAYRVGQRATGCAVSGTSKALTSGAFVSLPFDAADTFDSDAFHDPSSNNTRLTVPANLGGRYLLTAQVTWPSSGSANTDRRIGYAINGGTDVILTRDTWSVTSAALYGATSVVLALAAGDYVEVRQWTGIASTTTTIYSAGLILLGI